VRRVPFSCFTCPNSFWVAPKASDPIFMSSAPGHIFGGAKGVESRFHVLRSLTRFRWYRGRRSPFSCFACPNSFSAEPRASAPVFMFCVTGLVFGDTEGVGSRFHDLRARTHFRRYRGHRVRFSCFALSGTFSTVRRASGLNFMFCAPELVFGGTEGDGSPFHVLCDPNSFSALPRASIPFSYFALPNLFSAVRRVSGPVFIFCAPCHVFDGIEGVGPRFHILRSRTHFQRYLGHPISFSCFPLPYIFLAMQKASGPIFMFFAPEHVFGGIEGVGSRFQVLHARTRFRRNRGRRVPFSYFKRPDSFSAVRRVPAPVFMFTCPYSFSEVLRASSPVFMFCALVLIFGGTKGIGSRFFFTRPDSF
jgi:hypothetical protein